MARQKEQKEQQGAARMNAQQNTGSQAMQTQGAQGGSQPGQQTGLARRGQSSPSLTAGSPFSFMRRFSEEMDRLFEDFGFRSGWLAPSFGRDFFPAGFGVSAGRPGRRRSRSSSAGVSSSCAPTCPA